MISINILAQVGNVKVRKLDRDSINLIGKWVLLYDKYPDGMIVQKKEDIDALFFYPDKKYLRKKAGIQENGIWKLDWNNTLLRYQQIIISDLGVSPPTVSKRIDASNSIITIGQDTMILNLLPPVTMGDDQYRKRYYTKKK